MAKKKKINRKIIRKIVEKIPLEAGTPNPTKEEYLSTKISFSLKEETNPPIEKPEPYRGYSRGFKDGKSSKRTFTIEEFSSSPLIPGPNFEYEVSVLLSFAAEVSRNPRNNNSLTILKGFYETSF